MNANEQEWLKYSKLKVNPFAQRTLYLTKKMKPNILAEPTINNSLTNN